MAASAGRNLRVKVGTTLGGAYNNVLGIRSGTMTRQGMTVDISTLTDADVVRLLGQRDCSYRLEGNWESADATGQAVVDAAYTNDTALFLQFLPGTTTGWKQEVKVRNLEIGGEVGPNKIGISIELEGSGAITVV